MELFDAVKQWIDGLSLDVEMYGNPLSGWLTALAVAVVAFVVLRVLAALVSRRAAALAEKTTTELDNAVAEVLGATKLWFLLIVSLFLGTLVLDLNDDAKRIVQSITVVALLIQAAIWGNVLLTFGLSQYVKRRMEADADAVTTVSALGFVGKLVVWSVVVLLALDNLGIDVTALVAGLGVGGIAVALAAQNILGDLFASMSIVLDKPFVLGDFVIVGDYMGSVEHIGLKTTRIRSLSGEQLVFSNTDLLQSRIRNYKRMQERRVVFSLGVTYQTPADKLARIPALIRETVEAQEQTRFDRSHFKSYGDSALIFETVYYMLVPDYNAYMDVQQAINLALYRRFEEEGLEFAYPTQTVYVQQ